MKHVLLLLVLSASFFIVCSAQTIPNAGFENWTSGNPDNWSTSNILSFYTPVTQSATAHGGSSAVLGTVVSAFGGGGYPPSVVSGTNVEGFPINSRPAAMHGWYKFNSDSGDIFIATVAFQKNHNGMGAGGVYLSAKQTIYTEFVANISYSTSEIPDTFFVFISIGDTQRIHIGSSFLLDDLSFGSATTDVNDNGKVVPLTFALEQNYPNPFNPTTKIQFQIPGTEFVTLSVYNILGQKVATLVNERLQPGRYRAELNAGNLANGTYFYRLQAGNNVEVKKLMLMK